MFNMLSSRTEWEYSL